MRTGANRTWDACNARGCACRLREGPRLLRARRSLIEAIALAERGVASYKDIDVAMRLGASHPMGPIQARATSRSNVIRPPVGSAPPQPHAPALPAQLADYVGLDTCLSIIEGWQRDHPDGDGTGKFFVPESLRKKARPLIALCTAGQTADVALSLSHCIGACSVKVAEGKFGRKTGEGFYKWAGDKLA